VEPDPHKASATRRAWRDVRASLRGAEHDYTSGSLRQAIALLAIPTMLEMAMESLFAICDIFFVASLGPDAVAAVGYTEAMLTILFAIAIGMAMATTATVSRRIGEKDRRGASTAAAQAIYLGLAISAVIGLPCWIFAADLLALMGASDSVVEVGAGYTGLILGLNALIMMLFINNAAFRGAGQPVLAMRCLWLANGINLALDPCLIYGLGPFPELGVTGAAVATTIGRGSGVLYQFWVLRRGSDRIQLRGDTLKVDPAAMAKLLRLSLSMIVQFLIATSSWLLLMTFMSEHGDEAVAGYTIALRIIMFTLLPSWGLGSAAATLVGQSLGAEKPARAARAVWLTGLLNMSFLALVMLAFIAAPRSLVGIFTDDPAVTSIGADALRIIAYGYVFYAWGMVMIQAFNGAGDSKTPTWINLWCFWALQIPLAWWLTYQTDVGPQGVFWSVALAESALAVACVVMFRRGAWKTRKV